MTAEGKSQLSEAFWWNLGRYFLHGILLSFLLIAMTFLFAFALTALVFVGLIIGFIIGFILVFLIMGYLNGFLTNRVWAIHMKTGWKVVLSHGVVLFVLLLIVYIPALIANLFVPSLATTIVTLVVYAFVDGFVARKVAIRWATEPRQIVYIAPKISRRRLFFGITKNALAIIIELIIIFPIIWIVSASFRSYGSLLTTTLQIIPPSPTLEAYNWALAIDSPFWSALINSLFVCSFTTGFCILMASPAAYGMSRFRFIGKRPILYALIFVQFVPGLLMFIAFFYLLLYLGLYDNLLGLSLIYVALVLPFSIWNLKAFFDTIPRDIDEAALIDGASYFEAMINVVLPLSAPGLAVTAFFSFLTGWNEFALANIVLGSESNYTLPLRLYALNQREFATNWTHFAALSVISSIPLVILFFIIQRYLRAGLAIGAVKG